MFFRSGNFYPSRDLRNSELESRISTEESVHHFGGLLSIQETQENSSDTSSEMASHSTNPFEETNAEMGTFAESSHQGAKAFKMSLTFLYTNTHGAKIYGDPMDRQCVKIEDSLTDFQVEP